jgi:hypothetical protein
MHQQVVGNAYADNVCEIVDNVDEEFVEGRDDVPQCHATPRQCITNETCHQNFHLHDFSPHGNDPISRYSEVRGAYSLTTTIACSVARLMEGPPRSITDLAREYDKVSNLLVNATQDHRRAYYTVILQEVTVELNARMPAGSCILVTNAANAFMNSGNAIVGGGGTTENAYE